MSPRAPISLIIFILWICRVNGQAQACECVPFYLCNNGTININGQGVIDIRIKPEECPSYLEICCSKTNVVNIPTERNPPVPAKLGCGFRNPNGVGYRITGDGDHEAQFGEFPWMVAIFYKGRSDSRHLYRCGGALIHPEVVLTAAHCVSDSGTYKIRAGEWDSQTTNEIFKHQDKDVVSIVTHPSFTRKNLFNDVALLFLDSAVNIGQHINVACIPPQDSVVLSNECFVTGWGKNRFEKDDIYQVILKKIEVPVVPREQCQNSFRTTRLGRVFKLDRSFMCAGGDEGRDACTGDGGGPLVCPIPGQEDRYQQVGIVAWGIGCGTKGVPGAYVDVAYFRSWIDQQINKKSFNSNSYTVN